MSIGIPAFRIVGYAVQDECVRICAACAGDINETPDDNYTPIFAGDEDAGLDCDECGEPLLESAT